MGPSLRTGQNAEGWEGFLATWGRRVYLSVLGFSCSLWALVVSSIDNISSDFKIMLKETKPKPQGSERKMRFLQQKQSRYITFKEFNISRHNFDTPPCQKNNSFCGPDEMTSISAAVINSLKEIFVGRN